jgi:hypothetical protein
MRDIADIREVANDWNRRQRSLGRKARAATASLEEAFSERQPVRPWLTSPCPLAPVAGCLAEVT